MRFLDVQPTAGGFGCARRSDDEVCLTAEECRYLDEVSDRGDGRGLFDFVQAEAYSRRFGYLTPVVMPQPSRHTLSSGAAGLILATAISGSTVHSLKVDVPM